MYTGQDLLVEGIGKNLLCRWDFSWGWKEARETRREVIPASENVRSQDIMSWEEKSK